MKITVFMEYKVLEERRPFYLQQIEQIKREMEARGCGDYRWYEGIEQPNLFVEMFEVVSFERYEEIKAWRQSDTSFAKNIAGGAAKMHVWAFRSLEVSTI